MDYLFFFYFFRKNERTTINSDPIPVAKPDHFPEARPLLQEGGVQGELPYPGQSGRKPVLLPTGMPVKS